MFRVYDDDDTGKITAANLRRCAEELKEDVNEVSDEQIETMLGMADNGGTGYFQLEEFISLMASMGLIAERG